MKSNEVERFESFADDLILHRIVSFLPLEDAMRAAVVGRRWKDLWQLSQYINLDERKFTLDSSKQQILASDGRHSLANGIKLTGRSNFVALCRRFISLYRGEKVHTFRLQFSHPEEHHSDVTELVRIAATKGVEMLDLDFSNPDECKISPYGCSGFFNLPEAVYGQHESLHTLKLAGCIFQPARFGVFAALRSLTISRIEFCRRNLEDLMANCQRLEYLSLVKLRSLDFANIEDRAGCLKTLVVDECFPLDSGIRIHAPGLQSLKYYGSLSTIMPENLRSLVEVDFDFRLEEDFDEFGDLVSQLLLQLSNAKVLTVCSYTIQVLPSGEEPLRLGSIDVLKHLILRKTALRKEELPGVAFLLRSYTKLESLTIEIGEPRRLNGYEYPYSPALNGRAFWDSQIVPFACLRRHLKTVKIEGFKGLENEVEFLRFLLRKAHALQKMTIVVSREEATPEGGKLEHYTNAALVMQNLHRASSMAQVLVT